jgi:flagellar biosynthetic protein FlhB
MQILVATAKIILGLLIPVGIALLVIGVADALYQKYKYIQELKMTRQEVKRERKDIDGSPEVKSRMRRLQIEMSKTRMLQEVPKASVVLVNPTHFAVALRYDADTARAYGVPVIRKPELTRTIYSTVKLGGLIPQTLYMAVAEVLAMIHRLRHKNK